MQEIDKEGMDTLGVAELNDKLNREIQTTLWVDLLAETNQIFQTELTQALTWEI